MQSALTLVAKVVLELHLLSTLSRLLPADLLNAIFCSPSECQQTTVFWQGPDEGMTMAIFGCGRVSTSQQDTENQRL